MLKLSFSYKFVTTFLFLIMLYFISSRFSTILFLLPCVLFIVMPRFKMKSSEFFLVAFILLHGIFMLVTPLKGPFETDAFRYLMYGLYVAFLMLLSKIWVHNKLSYFIVFYVFMSIVLMFSVYVGIYTKYQHSSNIILSTIILICYAKFWREDWKVRIVSTLYILISLYFILTLGSRQSLLGLLLVMTAFFLNKVLKSKGRFLIQSIVVISTISTIIYYNFDIGNKLKNVNFALIERMSWETLINSNPRLIIYKDYLENISYYPNFLSFDLMVDHPHNYFFEIIYSSGYLLAIPFMLFVLYMLGKMIINIEKSFIAGLAVFYFSTFNLSAGLSVAKYFLVFTVLYIIFDNKKKREKENLLHTSVLSNTK